ncbi:uncharacterized protein MELLADRAFT_85627 [Melampsora larici-populina 98AG31]|uniref:Uncharacterized protein n=1 Tax=Melampsora larici-populina (strain 98AG31 / pathotype 3-4-7) TaxID=747676 RepID=F4RJ82_MELLP|nr:uncharacterized protein MELLADRAFT_85627 [Melampsora larici-populina 98AG31]EGG07547.1 hypothetical protein MELLADRAFT_85627 [Melampsora larici-populina 98AG31]
MQNTRSNNSNQQQEELQQGRKSTLAARATRGSSLAPHVGSNTASSGLAKGHLNAGGRSAMLAQSRAASQPVEPHVPEECSNKEDVAVETTPMQEKTKDTANEEAPTPGGAPSTKDQETEGDGSEEDNQNDREVFKSLSFKKVPRSHEPAAELPSTQMKREVKVAEAQRQYDKVKVLYDKTKEHVMKLESNAAEGAINRSLQVSKKFLAELHETMKENESNLFDALNSNTPEVVYVCTVYNPPTPATKPIPIAKKRKAGTPLDKVDHKKKKDVNPKSFLDVESKESNKETREEILGDQQGARGRKKSRAIITQEVDKWAEGPMDAPDPENNQDVFMKDAMKEKQAGKKKSTEVVTEGPDMMKVDENCIFHVAKPDLSFYRPRGAIGLFTLLSPVIVTETTPDEVSEIEATRDEIKSSHFNWGDVLAAPVANIIYCWAYDSDSTIGHPTSSDLAPHLMYVRSLVEDKELMILRLQTALHSMCVRTNRDPDWTKDQMIKGHIHTGYAILHNILADSLKVVAYDYDHSSINIRVDGEDGVHESTSEMSKTIAWLFRQCTSGNDDAISKRGKISNATVRTLQRKYFMVLMAVNLIVESEINNSIIALSTQAGATVRDIKSLKASQRKDTVIHQLMNDRNKYSTSRVKSIAASSAPPKSIEPASSSQAANPSTSKIPDKVKAQDSRDVSEFKKESLHYLALFLMFGTAGLFHTWPNYKEQNMPESAIFINLASLLVDRQYEEYRAQEGAHVFGAQAWNRLDDLMFTSLQMFLQEWDLMKLAGLFMLDLLTETHRPGLSLGINGLVMDHVNIEKTLLKLKLNGPETESFRALWGPTKGPLHPVTQGGSGLYPEKEPNGEFTKQSNPQTRMSNDIRKSKEKSQATQDVAEEDAEVEEDAELEVEVDDDE